MLKVTRCISQALLAVASLWISVCANRAEENILDFTDHAAESESAEHEMRSHGCPLMYSHESREQSNGQSGDMANQADWSAVSRAAIEALERIDAAGRGVSWGTFSGAKLDPGWIVQTPPAKIFTDSEGQSGLLNLLHQSVRCSGKK